MTPLLATLSAFQAAGEVPTGVWENVNRLLDDASQYRLNLFDKQKGNKVKQDRFRVRQGAVECWSRFDPGNHLWLAFGYQTGFGLLRWLLKGEIEATRLEIENFGTQFLKIASERWKHETGLPQLPPKNKCAQEGYLHRLCTDDDPTGQGVCQMLGHAIEHWKPQQVGELLMKLRSVVPLLHNEAYQLAPYGIGQVCFLLCGAWGADTQSPQDLYWRVIGKSIKRRLLAN
jgi:hypothetical protein